MVKILVVGDLIIDHYLWCNCDRISPEAPVPVVKINTQSSKLGGAGNVVSNLLALGADVGIISIVGSDNSGQELRQMLLKRGARIENLLLEDGRISSLKSRIMAVGQQILRIDDETSNDTKLKDELISSFKSCIDKYDAVLLSDYAKGVLTTEITQELIKIANEFEKPILVDPKGSDYKKYTGATLLTPNKKEASLAVGFEINSKDDLAKAAKKLKENFKLTHSLITISEDGIALINGDELEIFPANAKEVYDVTGAGDSVLATLGYCLAQNFDITKAIKLANLAAAVVVGKVGSADVSFKEIEDLQKNGFDRKMKSKDEILEILKLNPSKKTVFTNGCFDILHLGHIKYLQTAKSYADILIVGLNSDSSVKRLKGETRPVNSQLDRASLLSALEFVDYVVIFEEDTPLELIKAIKPDILVKGADYEGKEVVGSQFVKDVRLIEFVQDKSTTNIIKRIKC